MLRYFYTYPTLIFRGAKGAQKVSARKRFLVFAEFIRTSAGLGRGPLRRNGYGAPEMDYYLLCITVNPF